ncbi:lysosome-associated membrane glycoprotein 1 [Trachemys scripta elegans]|uniref:lysosome-associated membrane glycoprotein 1 n=1 Tax=Trachemys scripta elegans TaxID=31138 RepID=UPI00155261DC|nr:lysosome-associated membrane glycoprotein 1 [Trachemys scripta elegans]
MARIGGGRWLLLAAVLLVFLQMSSSAFEVTDQSGKVCIIANLSVSFSVEYSTKSGQQLVADFTLAQNAEVLANKSSCGKENASAPVLAIGFGAGHLLQMNFTKTSKLYSVDELTFLYNLSDTTVFPNSTGGKNEVSQKTNIQADLDTRYRCFSTNRMNMSNVTITLSNVTLQAYLVNHTLSGNETVCAADKIPTTPVAPTTTSQTPTSQAPTSPPQNPMTGKYNVTGTNGTCVLAHMGLQLNVTYLRKDGKTGLEVLNFVPVNTSFSGSCNHSSAFLSLTFGKTRLVFHFLLNTSTDKFFLHGVDVTTTLPSEAKETKLEAVNSSMSELRAKLGNSYKCNAEEKLWVTDHVFVNVFDVQVQVFKIDENKFGAVEECQLDENNMVIPIIVGAALAGLVLIVLIAYLIGRKRSHAGYQTI